jgi:conjugal transfer ATP-binding protein TraC
MGAVYKMTSKLLNAIFTRPQSLVTFLPWMAYEDGLFILADGGVGAAWAVTPAQAELEAVDSLEQFYGRIEAALLCLPQDGSVSGQVIVSVGPASPDDRHLREYLASCAHNDPGVPPIVITLARARHDRLLQGTAGFWEGETFRTRSLSMVLCLRFAPPNFFGRSFFRRPKEGIAGTLLEKAKTRASAVCSALEESLANLHASTDSTRLSPPKFKRVDETWLMGHVWPRLNPSLAGAGIMAPELRPGVSLRSHLVSTETVSAPYGLDLDGWQTRALSLRMLPSTSLPGMFDRLLACGEDVTMSIGFAFRDKARELGMLNMKRMMAFAQRFTLGGDVSLETEMLKNDLDDATRSMLEGRTAMTRIVTSVAICCPPLADILSVTNRIASGLAQVHGADPYLERHMGAQAYLASLPFGHDPKLEMRFQRDHELLTANLIHFFPLTGRWLGTDKVRSIMHTRDGDLTVFDPYAGSAPHTIISASTGAGKSFLTNLILMDILRASGRVYILDMGGSYRRLCGLVGGQYMEVQMATPLVLNPLDVAWPAGDTMSMMVKILQRFVRPADGSPVTGDLSDDVLLEKSLRDAFKSKGWRLDTDSPQDGDRGQEVLMRDVVAALERHGRDGQVLARRLYRFHGEGSYARFFDAPNRIDLSSTRFVVFDLQGLKEHPSLQAALLLCIMQRINAEMGVAALRGIPKVLVADESWSLLQDKASAEYIEYFSRTARKVGGALFCISQSLMDWKGGPAGETILQNSPNRIYLRQQAETLHQMVDLLKLTPEEIGIISSLATITGKYSEAFVRTEAGGGVMRYVPSPQEYWTFTTHAGDCAAFDEINKDGDVAAAIAECARRWPFGVVAAKRGNSHHV